MLVGALVAAPAPPAPAAEGRLGQFDGHGDVGSPRIPGSATYNAVSQEYALGAAGVNVWAKRDEFHFLWKRMKGDFILQARVELVGKGVDPHRKLGWMVRSGLEADAPYADAAVHGDGLTSLQYRRAAGAITEEVRSEAKGADVVQLERKGHTYTFSAARFGDPLTAVQLSDLGLGDDVLVGLFLCSHNPEVLERAVFRDVRIIRPAREGFVPYRDYIGSHASSSTARPSPSRRPTGRATAAPSSTTRAATGRSAAGSVASTSPRGSRPSSTPAPRRATTTTTSCRSTAR